MSYFCRSDRLTNKSGDGLEGYKVRALDKTSGAVVSIFADENGTALADNTAVVDVLGNYSYFIAHGVYQEEYLTPEGVRSFVRPRVNMAGDPDAVTDSQAARDAAEDAAALAGQYANASTDADIPGAPTGERGALWWARLAGQFANASTDTDIPSAPTGERGALWWARLAGQFANASTDADIPGAPTGERGALYWTNLAGDRATAAAASATSASGSASTATTKASEANTSATNAATSATAAASSATSASGSASTASTAATSATSSATAAATSETNAAASETAAAASATTASDKADEAAASVAAAIPATALDLTGMDYAELGTDGNLVWGAHNYLGPLGPFTEKYLSQPQFDRDATTHLYAEQGANILYMFPVIGQSWAAGQNQDATETPINTTAVDAGNALMLSSGAWPNATINTGFADLLEQVKSTSKQTICSSFALSLNTRLNAAIGRKVKVLMTVAALSGSPYSSLKRGTATWNELIRLILEARQYAAAAGYQLRIPGVLMLLGASDATTSPGITRDRQHRFLNQLWADLQATINAIVPQPYPVRLFPWVPDPSRVNNQNFPEVSIAYGEAHLKHPFIRPVGPSYWLERSAGAGDTLHPGKVGYYKAGEMFADAVLGECFGLPTGTCYVIDAWRSGSATFDFRFSCPVTIDTSGTVIGTSGITTSAGFQVSAQDGASATTGISSVAAVTGPNANIADTVRVTMSSAPATGRFSIDLACFPASGTYGPTAGARSLIRSASAFATSGHDAASLYHWAMPAKVDFQV